MDDRMTQRILNVFGVAVAIIGAICVWKALTEILPGGLGGVQSILACDTAMNFIRLAYEDGKYIAAICAAPTILAQLHITDGRKATCYPGLEEKMGAAVMTPCGAVQDGRVITGKTSGLMGASCAALLNSLKALANIRDNVNLISPMVLAPIQHLKVEHLGNTNPRLHTDEVLIALSMSAVTARCILPSFYRTLT